MQSPRAHCEDRVQQGRVLALLEERDRRAGAWSCGLEPSVRDLTSAAGCGETSTMARRTGQRSLAQSVNDVMKLDSILLKPYVGPR